uniref:protein SPMIP1 n=1 Tax=Centroberyx gerrardi TaxID=166262 RepID=UPI003AAE420F
MRGLLTTQSQNCYREQIQKEMLSRLAWKSRYASLYPSCFRPRPPGPTVFFCAPPPRTVLPPVTKAPEKQRDLGLMRPVSPQTRQTLYQAAQHGKGRSLYLQRRGQKRPEEKFDFPLLSSWEYGWRLGDYSLDYSSPASGRSSVVKNTFYARNGVFSIQSAADALG